MKCQYCFYEVMGSRHEDLCPYNPENTKKILMFLKKYVVSNSRFNKNFRPFPRPRELDEFCRHNKIARLQTITSRYLSPGERVNDWLVELLDYALFNNIIGNNEFPYFLQYLYDAWIFKSREEYTKLYEQSVCYEDGEDYFVAPSSSTINLLRTVGKSFNDERIVVDEYI